MKVRPVRLEADSDDGEFSGWPEELGLLDAERSAFLLFADPFTFPTEEWLKHQRETAPKLRVVGGMASDEAMPSVNGHWAMAAARRWSRAAIVRAWPPPKLEPHTTMRSGSMPGSDRAWAMAAVQSSSCARTDSSWRG